MGIYGLRAALNHYRNTFHALTPRNCTLGCPCCGLANKDTPAAEEAYDRYRRTQHAIDRYKYGKDLLFSIY